ncbi:MAG: hypothetical protein K8963_11230, partial [Proteobacteria bacterium]|nr:hypothetical protein [Pseudomonadota bacterium]
MSLPTPAPSQRQHRIPRQHLAYASTSSYANDPSPPRPPLPSPAYRLAPALRHCLRQHLANANTASHASTWPTPAPRPMPTTPLPHDPLSSSPAYRL